VGCSDLSTPTRFYSEAVAIRVGGDSPPPKRPHRATRRHLRAHSNVSSCIPLGAASWLVSATCKNSPDECRRLDRPAG
jgi:hypothetical protein